MLLRKYKWRKPLATPQSSWEDNIIRDLREIGLEIMNGIQLVQNSVPTSFSEYDDEPLSMSFIKAGNPLTSWAAVICLGKVLQYIIYLLFINIYQRDMFTQGRNLERLRNITSRLYHSSLLHIKSIISILKRILRQLSMPFFPKRKWPFWLCMSCNFWRLYWLKCLCTTWLVACALRIKRRK